MRFRRLLLCLILSLLSVNYIPVYSEDELYYVTCHDAAINEQFNSYSRAISYYNDNKDNFDNLVLKKNDEVLEMEYGIVKFNVAVDYIKYHSIVREEDDYLCASYGIDGAYLYRNNNRVYFMLASDVGYVDYEDVELIPYEQILVKTSLYTTDDKYIYHNIKTQLDFEFCNNSYRLDFVSSDLDPNAEYYSYDGHYFYDDFHMMIDDYRDDCREHAVNKIPYYNYYQYLSHRSISNYSYLQLEDYFYNTLGIDGKLIHYKDLNNDKAADEINRSQLYGEIHNFFAYESLYGTNAMLLISSALYESSYGRSENSFKNNNLYQTAAYETYAEKQDDRFDSINSSIYSHCKYIISNRFSNHNRKDYKGTFLGNQIGGMNIEYSIDQYYGEKVASTYFDIDNELGLKDYNNYSIGIIVDNDKVNFYSDEALKKRLFSLKDIDELACIILNETEDAYKVQIDYSYDSDYLYSYEDCVAYLEKDEVSYVINQGNIIDYDFIDLVYDFNGGTFIGKDSLNIKVKRNNAENLDYIRPVKSGYEFKDYDCSIEPDFSKITFRANYKKIDSISIGYLMDRVGDCYPYMDLEGAFLNVLYEDGTGKKVPINCDMLENYDSEDGEKEITVKYCGLSTAKKIFLDGEYYEIVEAIDSAYKEGNYEYVKDNSGGWGYPFSMNDIRRMDAYFKKIQLRNYFIKRNNLDYDFSISGLDFSLRNYGNNFAIVKNTYYVILDDVSFINKEKIEKLSKGYGFDIVGGLNISFKYNYVDIELQNPAVLQIDIEDKRNNHIYSVYHINDDGDIIKCNTTWSNNYIQFMIEESGDYLVLSMPSVNKYDIVDRVENLSLNNMGYDNHDLNIKVMTTCVLFMLAFMGVIIYYIVENKRENEWRDFKKLLRNQVAAAEEKQKN